MNKLFSFSSRVSKAIFMAFTLMCLAAAGVCVIVDLALNRGVTWAAYPLLAIPFGWLAAAPLIFGKPATSLLALTALAFPFLFLLEKVTPVTGWFHQVGMPSAIAGAAFVWAFYLMFRYAKISLWFKSAAAVFLGGAVLSPVINYFADSFTGYDRGFLESFVSIFSSVAVAVLLGVLGYIRRKPKK